MKCWKSERKIFNILKYIIMIQIESWRKQALAAQWEQPYIWEIKSYLLERKQTGAIIYPESKDIFAAFDHSSWENTRVVILWQDPYHGAGQAHGLSFSVSVWIPLPPSLVNIYKEVKSDYPNTKYDNGDLTHWADQWVLLLNSLLTVEAGKPLSHAHIWWQYLTDAAISALSTHKEHVVFMLWGKWAQSKAALIDWSRHLILESSHPSPLGAWRGFVWCGHFCKCNEYLKENGLKEIRW